MRLASFRIHSFGIHSFRGLGAVVTGASSGIGRALALRLAREGARLALVARRADALEALAEEVRAAGGEAHAVPADLGERVGVATAADRARAALGAVDLLVHGAGYGRHASFLEWDPDDIERMFRVNALGAILLTRRLVPEMAARGRGTLVFIASVAGRIASPEESVYAATKFALVGFAESLSIELEDRGIHVLTVCPGVIDTPFFDAETRQRLPDVSRRQMVGVDGLVEDVIRALRRGRRTLTHPRSIAPAYVVKALAPGLFRRMVRRTTLGSGRPDPRPSAGTGAGAGVQRSSDPPARRPACPRPRRSSSRWR